MTMRIWDKLKTGLTRTRASLVQTMGAALKLRGKVDAPTLERLEEALLQADVGPDTADALVERARARMGQNWDLDLRTALEQSAAELLKAGGEARFEPQPPWPWVAFIIGVNGAGKTTFAGKLAAHFSREGHPTTLVAADTFRAAASEQLDVWAKRAGVEVVRGRDGADPAAVTHDGLTASLSRGRHVVLVDTAGRLHTKQNLMAELGKVTRIASRVVPGAPHHVLLVLDGTQGLNGLSQAREFSKAGPVTSVAVTKLDGTSRGGALLAIAHQLQLPVSLVGVGETLEDWQPFDADRYAAGLFEAD